jgi:hypothetical protein
VFDILETTQTIRAPKEEDPDIKVKWTELEN